MPIFKERITRLENSAKISAPPEFKRVEGKSVDPTLRGGLMFDNAVSISLRWNEKLRGDANESGECPV